MKQTGPRTTRRGYLQALAGVAGLSAGASVLAACQWRAAAPPPTKLQGTLELWLWDRYWGPGTAGETVVKEFTAQHPELKITFDAAGTGDTRLPVAAAAGAVPDVSHLGRFLAAEFGVKGIIQPLNEHMKGVKGLAPGDWRDGLRSDVTWKDKVYAVPLASTIWAYFWNQRVYQETGLDPNRPPATWDELRAHSSKLHRGEPGGSIQRYGFAPQFGNGGAQAAWLIFMWQQGQEELSPDKTKAIFNNAAGLRALELVLEFVTAQGGGQRFTAFRDGLTGGAGTAPLALGHISAHLDVNNQPTIWRRTVPDMNIGTGLIPKPSGGKDVTYQAGPAQVIPGGAKNVPAAIRFLEHSITKEAELRWADVHELIPQSKATAQSDAYLSKAPERKTLVQLALGGKWVPVVPGGQKILDLHLQFTNDAVNGVKSPRDALTWAQTEIQKVLDEFVR